MKENYFLVFFIDLESAEFWFSKNRKTDGKKINGLKISSFERNVF